MPSANSTTSSRRSAPYTILARNEVTGLRERISITSATKAKYANIGKPRKVVKPRCTPLIKRLDPEYREMIAEDQHERDESLARKRRWAEEIQQESLLERLAIQKAEKLSLLERMDLQYPGSPYASYSIPNKKIRKISTDKRHDDYLTLVNTTAERLNILRQHLVDEGTRLSQRPSERIKERHQSVAKLIDYVDQVVDIFRDKDLTSGLTHSDWRALKRDCKAIGRVKFDNLDKRWNFVAQSLANIEVGGAFSYLF
ncbi:hypothetical protein BDY19DRAFT_910328 [Irpex rosettiformis]|uniref:Uncharacterized protein n=1 Tax=Irpex rosettiformis TaxID=378272 RepID=A0ACB8TP74_9APHY|nr:hypothetical protein BDY19DRAFT_910328 [Irpex rosettiformis]